MWFVLGVGWRCEDRAPARIGDRVGVRAGLDALDKREITTVYVKVKVGFVRCQLYTFTRSHSIKFSNMSMCKKKMLNVGFVFTEYSLIVYLHSVV